MDQLALSLTPSAHSPTPAAPDSRVVREGHSPLWLCIHLPQLPLEVIATEPCTHPPQVVVEDQGLRPLVHAVSPTAEQRGIRAGLALQAAYALCPELRAHPRDPTAEEERLRHLAIWAQGFTPTLSLSPPQALLLEVRGSLRLFGGLTRIRDRLMEGLKARGHHFTIAVTPTPLASLWLARAGQARIIGQPGGALRTTLGKLPLTRLPLDSTLSRRLIKAGLHTLGDLWRLPRAGLARRFGPGLLHILDQALGTEPDPRPTWNTPRRLREKVEFEEELLSHPRLLEHLEPLLQRLCGNLRAANAAITRLHVHLLHASQPVTRIILGTRRATRDPTRLLNLFREHLQRTRLPMGVRGVHLVTDRPQAYEPEDRGLFTSRKESNTDQGEWERVMEQLQARLGRERVAGLSPHDDQRPEQAWRDTPTQNPGHTPPSSHRRPLWLLPAPEPLPLRQGHPWRHGRLSLRAGPERIEAGWWEGRDIRRDYFLATDSDGSHLWIFRDLRPPGNWYLHGYFG